MDVNFYNKHITSPVEPVLNFSKEQLEHRDFIQNNIESEYLKFIKSKCFCGNKTKKNIVIDYYDAWGFNIPTVVCGNCLAMRSDIVLDDSSIYKFYSEGFYHAHMFTFRDNETGVGIDLERYSDEELAKGEQIFHWLTKNEILKDVKTVLEIGTGCGGIAEYFRSKGYITTGCDLNREYIEYGIKKFIHLELISGQLDELKGRSFDLILMSDLLEHITNPLEFLDEIKIYMHQNTKIYINVPGLMGISSRRFGCNIRQYLKIEHVWGFTKDTLNYLMFLKGYKMIASTEYVRAAYVLSDGTSIYKKPNYIYKIRLFIHIFSLPVRKKLNFTINIRKIIIKLGLYNLSKKIIGLKNVH